MRKQILITGGAGFVGSHLADGLLQAGHAVRILDDLTPQVHPAGVPDYLSPGVELMIGDVRDPNRLKEALAGVDVVYRRTVSTISCCMPENTYRGCRRILSRQRKTIRSWWLHGGTGFVQTVSG